MKKFHQSYIIAEAGVNHNGSISRAKKLIDIAKASGADAVKFQTFLANALVTKSAPLANYQKSKVSDSTQLKMLQKLELSKNDFLLLKKYAASKQIDFLSTPFDLESLFFLLKELRLTQVKISSGDLLNAQLLLEAARANVKIILSTGMATIQEIEQALGVLCFGYSNEYIKAVPSTKKFSAAYKNKNARKAMQKKVTILHCTTEYPAPFDEINLLAISLMKQRFQCTIGYSDHTEGSAVSVAAVALGAQVIEKHFTISKRLKGPDHKMSLNPAELRDFITNIRNTEAALGEGKKEPTKSELKNKSICRKSLVAAKNIAKGEKFSLENITTKRPGTGISSMKFWDFLGKVAAKNYSEDILIKE